MLELGLISELASGAAEPLLSGWRARVDRARAHLGWPMQIAPVVRRHAGGASLAIAAPCDQLFTATEINEWALCATLAGLEPARGAALESALISAALENAPEPVSPSAGDSAAPRPPQPPPVIEEVAALTRFTELAEHEARPALGALLAAAQRRGLPYVLDETLLTLGAGADGARFCARQSAGAR